MTTSNATNHHRPSSSFGSIARHSATTVYEVTIFKTGAPFKGQTAERALLTGRPALREFLARRDASWEWETLTLTTIRAGNSYTVRVIEREKNAAGRPHVLHDFELRELAVEVVIERGRLLDAVEAMTDDELADVLARRRTSQPALRLLEDYRAGKPWSDRDRECARGLAVRQTMPGDE